MRKLLTLYILFFTLTVYGQIDELFDSFDNSGEWTSPGGNTGSHSGELCFNIIGNYLAGQFYVFQSPIYDFSTWTTVDLVWSQESSVRPGDLFALFYYDNGWVYFDLSNLNGIYGATLPNTTIALAFVLNSSGTGSLDGKYCHVDRLSIFDSSALPVDLLNFDVELEEAGVLLKWATASENNSDYYSIYRSADGSSWDLLKNVQAAGYSTSKIDYSYFDDNIKPGYSYYKLKQVDMDGENESWGPIGVFRNYEDDGQYYNIIGQKVDNFQKGLVISSKNGLMFKQ